MDSSNSHDVSVSYQPDSLSRLSTVTDNNLTGSNTTTYTYDTASNVATVTYPNGVQSTFSYDTLNRVTGLSSTPASYTYTRGATGNLTGVTESSGRTAAWTYDGIYRLTNETISLAPSGKNGSVSYGLDPVGNRSSESSTLSGISSGSFTFNQDDEVASETYDQNGNVIVSGSKTFGYDSQNQLISMTASGTSASMVYDAFGNRVSKTVSGVTTKYLVDDLNPTGYQQVFDELNGSGTVTRTYTYGLQRIDENQLISGAWTPSFYGYDGGGNVRQLTSTAGTVTDSYEYDAYGNEFTVSGSTPNEFMYRGEQYDSDLGLYYLRARYYNPLTGRFMSRDPNEGTPVIPQTLHKYLYAAGDPVDRIDPRGRADLLEFAIRASAAIPEAELIDIYGCVAGAGLTAVDLVLGGVPDSTTGKIGAGLGIGSAVIGCVVLVPGLNELAEAGAKTTKAALEFVGTGLGWGACAADAESFVNGLNDLATGKPNAHNEVGNEIGESLEALEGCVGSALGAMLKGEAE